MQADGTERRRAGAYGAPFWSADGREFLVNNFPETPGTLVMNFEKMTGGTLELPGYRIYSWPSWAGPGKLVSALSANRDDGDTIALLDVSNPIHSTVIEVLWTRSKELDVSPRWPVYWPETRRCFFSGVEQNKRTLYSFDRGNPRDAKPVSGMGEAEHFGGLSFSPDGRYLLFHSDQQ